MKLHFSSVHTFTATWPLSKSMDLCFAVFTALQRYCHIWLKFNSVTIQLPFGNFYFNTDTLMCQTIERAFFPADTSVPVVLLDEVMTPQGVWAAAFKQLLVLLQHCQGELENIRCYTDKSRITALALSLLRTCCSPGGQMWA